MLFCILVVVTVLSPFQSVMMVTGDIHVDTSVELARMANYVTQQMDIVHWAALQVIKGKHAEKVDISAYFSLLMYFTRHTVMKNDFP